MDTSSTACSEDEDEIGTRQGDKDTRSRAWFMTINNYSPEELAKVKAAKSIYLCVCEEVGEQGTPHIHCWMYFKSDKFFSKMKKDYPRADIRQSVVSRGMPARNYCLGQVKKKGFKDNPTFYEVGEMPAQGKRSDITVCREKVLEGGNMRDVVKVASSIQGIRMAELMFKYTERKRNWKPKVKWYYGPTGCGKSHAAHTELEDAFPAHTTIKWWEGYDAHENVVIDDMRGDFCKFHELLKLLDKYPFLIECKGGSRQFLAKNIIITSCHHPKDLFETREDLEQLLRRIDEIKHFTVRYVEE